MTPHATVPNWSETYFSSHDGLRLFARRYPAAEDQGRRPLLCLPGLTRNSRDFHVLADHLSAGSAKPRDVYCIDYRGRGRSARDRDWRNYTPYIELLDTLNFMTVAGLHGAAVIGTSRGGILAMLMAVMRPTAISVCVLNDIGPVIETAGLARIIGYVGKTPAPASWEEAVSIVRRMNEPFFPALDDAEWRAVTRQFYADVDGCPQADYDPKLAKTLKQIDLGRKIPTMWPQFTALADKSVLVLRGENSDLLSEETVREMAQRHPKLKTHTVPGQGHAPLLRDSATIATVERFLIAADPA